MGNNKSMNLWKGEIVYNTPVLYTIFSTYSRFSLIYNQPQG